MPEPWWEDAWPSRIGPDGKEIPRIWKRPDKPDPDKDHTFKRHNGMVVSYVDEEGNWRWPWWYRIPGWCACYTDSFQSALAIVNRWWQEEWLMKHFPDSKINHTHVTYPWGFEDVFTGYEPPGVYTNA